MKMYFHFGDDSQSILVEEWTIAHLSTLFGAIAVVIILAFSYECLKSYREYLLEFGVKEKCHKYANANSCNRNETVVSKDEHWIKQMFTWIHLVQTVLHVAQITVSYFLMLIVMTYNIWLFIAVIFGATLGYFASAWKRRHNLIDKNECCN